ncbi:MAG: glycosyltransferase family 2 protein [Psychroflexus sp.]
MKTNPTLEILISTMNRKDLSFLEKMFPVLDLEQYQLLIINQTKLDEDLVSDVEGIRIINSREFGLSKSRNLAIENAKGDILVFADDDIEYLPGFDKTILKAYETYPKASLISFQFVNENNELAKYYPKKEGYIKSSKRPLSSVEITFKKKDIIDNGIRLNENFGLGSTFPCGEEQLFKRDFLQHNLKVAFVVKPIVIHTGKTSGSSLQAKKSIEANTAQKYIQYKKWTYLWMIKYVFFLFRHSYISFFGQIKAYRIGMKAISKLKKIKHED